MTAMTKVEVLRAVCCVAGADESIDDVETRFLQELAKKAGVGRASLGAMMDRSVSEPDFYKQQFRVLKDQPEETMKLLFGVAALDGALTARELEILQLFGERLAASSAGAQPRGEVHPLAFKTLMSHGLTIEGLRSEPIEPYVGRAFDLVITLCDTAAAEPCPSFPGAPATAHWPLPDPPAATQPEIAFVEVYRALWDAIEQLSSGHGTGDAAERAAAIGEDVAERFGAY